MSLEDELRQAEAQNDRLSAALEVEVGARRSLAESLAAAYFELEETRKKLMLARHQWVEAASELSDGLGMDRCKKIMLLAMKEALKEVVAAVVECEEARDTAERRMIRLKEQEASLRGLIREW